jgi:hypothetical protein
VIPPRDRPPTPDEIARELRLVNARQVVRINALGGELRVAHRQAKQLRDLLDEVGADVIDYDRGVKDGFAAGKEAARRTVTGIDLAMIGELVRLTHPDRHPPERRDAANRVTALLMEMRDELRAR